MPSTAPIGVRLGEQAGQRAGQEAGLVLGEDQPGQVADGLGLELVDADEGDVRVLGRRRGRRLAEGEADGDDDVGAGVDELADVRGVVGGAAVSMKSAAPPDSSAAAWAPSQADWLNDLSSTLPTSVTRPMLISSTGSRAGQSTAALPAVVVSAPPVGRVGPPPRGVGAALGGRRLGAAGGRGLGAAGASSRRRRRSSVPPPAEVVAGRVLVVAAARRERETADREHSDELGRFHAPPQFLCRGIGPGDPTPRVRERNSARPVNIIVSERTLAAISSRPSGMRRDAPGLVRASMAARSDGQPARAPRRRRPRSWPT